MTFDVGFDLEVLTAQVVAKWCIAPVLPPCCVLSCSTVNGCTEYNWQMLFLLLRPLCLRNSGPSTVSGLKSAKLILLTMQTHHGWLHVAMLPCINRPSAHLYHFHDTPQTSLSELKCKLLKFLRQSRAIASTCFLTACASTYTIGLGAMTSSCIAS